MENTLEKLTEILEQRKQSDPKSSYVAGLYHKGLDSILKKVGEEATETILAAKSGDKSALIYETADLWFHTMVMLVQQDCHPQQVLAELERRFGLSGIQEKADRKQEGA